MTHRFSRTTRVLKTTAFLGYPLITTSVQFEVASFQTHLQKFDKTKIESHGIHRRMSLTNEKATINNSLAIFEVSSFQRMEMMNYGYREKNKQ